MTTNEEVMMTDIKLRNVKLEHADEAIWTIQCFMTSYPERRGIRNGVAYGGVSTCPFYVYRTDKTVVCVGQYKET